MERRDQGTPPGAGTRPDLIRKDLRAAVVRPHLIDYDAACSAFSWDDVRAALGVSEAGTLNIGRAAVDRHVVEGHGDHVALRWLGRDGLRRDVTYDHLASLTTRFAAGLRARGVGKGDHVFVLAPRTVDL